MIGLGSYLAFIVVSLVVICTPGQDTALTVRNTIAGGRAAGIATAVGVATGQAAWTLASAAGLALLLTAAQPLFLAIRLAGAAYLVYLGIRLLRSRPEPAAAAGNQRRRRSALVQGLVSNLTNAKMVAFFVSLLPQFTGPRPAFGLLVALGLTFCVLTLLWLCAYAIAVARLSRWLDGPRIRTAVDRLAGAVLVAPRPARRGGRCRPGPGLDLPRSRVVHKGG